MQINRKCGRACVNYHLSALKPLRSFGPTQRGPTIYSYSRMVNSCCALNCSIRDTKVSTEVGIKFYLIPHKEPNRTLCLNAINRKNFQPRAHTVICSQHFVGGECYYRYTTSGSYVAINYNQKICNKCGVESM